MIVVLQKMFGHHLFPQASTKHCIPHHDWQQVPAIQYDCDLERCPAAVEHPPVKTDRITDNVLLDVSFPDHCFRKKLLFTHTQDPVTVIHNPTRL